MQIYDLHGLSVHNAWQHVMDIIDDCHRDNIKKIKIITGKGKISEEFEHWIDSHPCVRQIEPAKDRGSYIVWIAISKLGASRHT